MTTAYDPPEPFDRPQPAAPPRRELTVIEGGASSLPPIALEALANLDLTALEPDDLGNLREMVLDAKRETASRYAAVIDRVERECERRIKEAGGRAIAAFDYKIELVEEFTPYAFDEAKLRDALRLLRPDEAKKIGEVIAAREVFVPEHFVIGKSVVVSALALVKKYGEESPVGKALASAMSRSRTGDKVVIKKVAG